MFCPFIFKNKYAVKDSFNIQETIAGNAYTRATVYIDSVIAQNGITRYACRIKCLPRNMLDTTHVATFNMYDKFIPDVHWDLYTFCTLAFYDGYYYIPLCFSDNATSYHTPNYTGNCDTISRTTLVAGTVKSTDIQIFPNPASTYITIKSNQKQTIAVHFRNINGVEVLQRTISVPNNLDIHHLPNGIYIVTIVSDLGVSILVAVNTACIT